MYQDLQDKFQPAPSHKPLGQPQTVCRFRRVVLRDDLDPRLGQRDDDLIAQYAEIIDELPPIEINQDNVLIDGWHRVRAAEG